MDFSDIQLFRFMKTKMEYLSQRQQALAKNIANVDTPGFTPQDLKPLDFNRLAMLQAHRIQMRMTSPKHIQGLPGSNRGFKTDKQRDTYETSPVKDSVSPEEQLMKVAENNLAYQQTTNLYKKTVDLFKIAIGNRG